MKRPFNDNWTQRDGQKIPLWAMGTTHIENTLALLVRHAMTERDDELLIKSVRMMLNKSPKWMAERRDKFRRKWIALFRQELDWREWNQMKALDTQPTTPPLSDPDSPIAIPNTNKDLGG